MSAFSFPRTEPITNVGDILYYEDTTRGKFLSITRETLFYSHDSADNEYVRPGGLDTPSVDSGIEMTFQGTIVNVAAHAGGGDVSKSFEIRRNNVATPLYTFSFPGFASPNISFSDGTVNVDFIAGDHLQVFAVAAGSATTDIVVLLEVAWRL
jgi:hypothetical protein